MLWTQKIVKPEYQFQFQSAGFGNIHKTREKREMCKEGKVCPEQSTTEPGHLSTLEPATYSMGETQQGMGLLTLLGQESGYDSSFMLSADHGQEKKLSREQTWTPKYFCHTNDRQRSYQSGTSPAPNPNSLHGSY